jgi:hypothetical protein
MMKQDSEKVRQYVKAHAGHTRAQIAAGTGIDGGTVAKIVYGRVKRGEFLLNDTGGHFLNPDFVRGKHTDRLPKKVRGFRAEKRERKAKRVTKLKSVAQVARRHLDKAAVAPSPVHVHVHTTFTVLEAVLDLEGAEPMLVAAFRAHKEALEIAGA